jgi:hypothetical protein
MTGPSPATTRRGRAFAGAVVGFVALVFGLPLLAQTDESGFVAGRSQEADQTTMTDSMVSYREDQVAAAKAVTIKRKQMPVLRLNSVPAVAPQLQPSPPIVAPPIVAPAAPEPPTVVSDALTTALINAVSVATAGVRSGIPATPGGEAVSIQLAEAPPQMVETLAL